MFCGFQQDSNRLNLFPTSRGNWGFRAESCCQFNCLFEGRGRGKKKKLCVHLLDSHLCLWALATCCCWVLLLDCPSLQQWNGAMLRWFVLFPNFFSGISSCQLPSPTHPLYCAALRNPPSVWRRCQTLWHMKTIVPLRLGRHNLLLRQAFSSPPYRRLLSGQADKLPPLPPSPGLGGRGGVHWKQEMSV